MSRLSIWCAGSSWARWARSWAERLSRRVTAVDLEQRDAAEGRADRAPGRAQGRARGGDGGVVGEVGRRRGCGSGSARPATARRRGTAGCRTGPGHFRSYHQTQYSRPIGAIILRAAAIVNRCGHGRIHHSSGSRNSSDRCTSSWLWAKRARALNSERDRPIMAVNRRRVSSNSRSRARFNQRAAAASRPTVPGTGRSGSERKSAGPRRVCQGLTPQLRRPPRGLLPEWNITVNVCCTYRITDLCRLIRSTTDIARSARTVHAVNWHSDALIMSFRS